MPTDEGWLYVASVIDLASRRLLGYSMSERADTAHVINALEMAVAMRGVDAIDGTIFHSDRGSTYTSALYRSACERLGCASRSAAPARVWTTPSPKPGSPR